MNTLIKLDRLKNKQRINFRLDEEMTKQLNELHQQSALSQSLLIRI